MLDEGAVGGVFAFSARWGGIPSRTAGETTATGGWLTRTCAGDSTIVPSSVSSLRPSSLASSELSMMSPSDRVCPGSGSTSAGGPTGASTILREAAARAVRLQPLRGALRRSHDLCIPLTPCLRAQEIADTEDDYLRQLHDFS